MSTNVMSVRFSWLTPSALPDPGHFFEVVMTAEPEYPHGRRGMWMSRCWDYGRANGADGLLCLDGDTAVDPVDVAVMCAAIEEDAESVHTAPVRLYPPYGEWIWAHGRDYYTQECVTEGINLFGFAFTWLPGSLLDDCVDAGLEGWRFPLVNKKVSGVAREASYRVSLVPEVWPAHLNWG
jgi:hypothetical protein